MGGKRHTPAALPLGKTRYPLYRRLGGPQSRSGLVRKISPPTGIQSPDLLAPSESLYWLPYLGSLLWACRNYIYAFREACVHLKVRNAVQKSLLYAMTLNPGRIYPNPGSFSMNLGIYTGNVVTELEYNKII